MDTFAPNYDLERWFLCPHCGHTVVCDKYTSSVTHTHGSKKCVLQKLTLKQAEMYHAVQRDTMKRKGNKEAEVFCYNCRQPRVLSLYHSSLSDPLGQICDMCKAAPTVQIEG